MDSSDTDDRQGKAPRKSSAERVRKHRRRKQKLELQMAVGVAKLVTGKGAGDQGNALLGFLVKAARGKDLPDDQLSLLDEAIDKLKSRPRY